MREKKSEMEVSFQKRNCKQGDQKYWKQKNREPEIGL